ncbi:MAG: hypothetical protein AAB726_02240 [Patescibacteria group bacterium]
MTSLRPSKRVAFVFIACLLALGTVVFAAQYSTTSSANGANGSKSAENGQKSGIFDTKDSNNPSNAVDSEFLKKISDLDDDGDGIKNWEETLVGLEASGGVNGSAGGSSGVSGGAGAGAEIEENLSETEKFSREFFAKYIEAKRTGTVNQEELIESLASANISVGQSKKYSISDLKLVPEGKNDEENEENMKKYGNSVGLVLLNNQITANNNEYEILNVALNDKSASDLQRLDASIARYEGIVLGLRLTGVPVAAALAHLEVVNSFEAIKGDVSGFKKMFSDPIVGLASIKKYGEDTAALNSAIDELKNIFATQNITFTQSEYGYALTNAI